ncbi:GntR family transcriptional regulator [Paenibacillus qinlingensis]|uniref:DNA-binding LacI/PurR family transcriptional regulator n=1 Tax=Paenibacillus qinlingensis TaxID=1837343 RepID=A0ABU1P0I2_9BACL|nr:GntR family transcriptional regulator [Paenibacillus qinlingensis]MDR6553235.1 DNA-binding LacI/PurR family transcriptional regulator [Paenibacillus qinlingensis]
MEAHLYEQLYWHIVHEIKEGKLKVGDRVSSEKELAEQFGVSRITSKKALEKLAEEGLVKRIQGKGSFVAQPVAVGQEPMRHSEERAILTNVKTRPLIGFIISNFSDEFGLQLLRAMERQSAAHNYDLIIKRTWGSRAEEERAIQLFVSLGIKGLIVTPIHGEHYNADLLRLVLDKFPVVLVDRYLRGIPVCSVYTDNKKAAKDLTLHLIGRGHKEIAFLSPPVENTSTLEDRLLGYTLAFTQEGLKLHLPYCLTSLKGILPINHNGTANDSDKLALQGFLEQYPEVKAFVASEFLVATLLTQVIDEMGKSLDDYDIVCFDSLNDHLGKPIFTHIQQDEKRMGEGAVDLLVSQLIGEAVPEQRIIEHRMIVRA